VDFMAVDENLRESFRILAADRGSGEVRQLPGVFIAHAGVAFQMFNAAFLSAPVRNEIELARRIAQASVFFETRQVQWSFWVCEGWLAPPLERKARTIFQRHGMRYVVEMPGMIAEWLTPPVRPLPTIEVRRVSGTALRRVFCELGSACFHVPPAWFREVFDTAGIWRDFAGYVAFAGKEAVSTAAVVVSPAAIGVYNVATLPGRQRRGYGEAVMRYAIERARDEHGLVRSILQSTPQGLTLYERMGYSRVTKVTVYAS
jgi:GNAT superfamily N-acetyltransferase